MRLKETAIIQLLGLTKIPMLFLCSPRVMEFDERGCAVKIPLNRITKNHVGSLYLGVLTVGADVTSGLNALMAIRERRSKVIPLFKDLHAEFLKRADGDVLFRCTQGAEITAAVEKAEATGERVTLPIHVVATVPTKYGDEPVARFTTGLTLKKK